MANDLIQLRAYEEASGSPFDANDLDAWYAQDANWIREALEQGALGINPEFIKAPVKLRDDSDAASVQVGILEGDRATPAAGDEAYVSLRLSDSAGVQTEFGRLVWKGTDVTDTTEDGELSLSLVKAGVLTQIFRITSEQLLLPENNDIGDGAGNNAGIGYFNEGVQLSTSSARPAADSSLRGRLWTEQGAAGVADKLQICLKKSDDTYAWFDILEAP